jgi:integrase
MAEMQSRPAGRGSTPPGPLAAGPDAGGLRPGGGAERNPLERPGARQRDHAQDPAPTRGGAQLFAIRPVAGPGTLTLRESRDAWLRDRRRGQVSAETRVSYRETSEEFLAVVGPDRPADSITVDDLDRYLDDLDSLARAHGALSLATKGGRIGRVRAWLNWAWREGDLVTPLGQHLKPPPVPVTTPAPLPPAQLRAMLAQVTLQYQTLLLVLLDTGLRVGDALRLRRTDLRHMQDGQPYFEVTISKTHSGGHSPISATTEKVLRRYLEREVPALWKQAWGTRRLPDDGYIFFSTQRWGQPLNRRTVEKRFAQLKAKTGWTGKCSPHVLRHTAGNFAAEMGLNEVRIAQYLGHRTLRMVKRYTGKVSVIRDFDAVSPANALGDIPAPAARRHGVAREAARQLKRNRWLHEEDHPK